MPETKKEERRGWKVPDVLGKFVRNYWQIPLATALITCLAAFLCIRFCRNGSLLWVGGILIVGSIVSAIVFSIIWVTRRYRIRQELIFTYGRECCAPFRSGGIWKDFSDMNGSLRNDNGPLRNDLENKTGRKNSGKAG